MLDTGTVGLDLGWSRWGRRDGSGCVSRSLDGGSWIWCNRSSWNLWGSSWVGWNDWSASWHLRGGDWVAGDWYNSSSANRDRDSAWGSDWVSRSPGGDGGWNWAFVGGQQNSFTKQNQKLTVGGGCSNGDCGGGTRVGVCSRAWAISDGQGRSLGHRVGMVSCELG